MLLDVWRSSKLLCWRISSITSACCCRRAPPLPGRTSRNAWVSWTCSRTATKWEKQRYVAFPLSLKQWNSGVVVKLNHHWKMCSKISSMQHSCTSYFHETFKQKCNLVNFCCLLVETINGSSVLLGDLTLHSGCAADHVWCGHPQYEWDDFSRWCL